MRPRGRVAVGAALAGAAWVVHLASCGEDPVCGDGVQQSGEECDDGNADQTDGCRACVLAPRTTVIWRFDRYPERGFSGDTCLDVGATKVRVEAVGPVTVSQEAGCGDGQVVLLALPDGAYTFAVTPVDGSGASLVKAPAMAQASNGATVNVDVPWDAWSRTYTGSLLFRLTWGGQSCAVAAPPVATQELTLTASNQQVVSQVTDTGQRLDGMIGPCRASTDEFPQSALALPFGPATLLVVGKDASGTERFRHAFDTFIGVGMNNPTLTYDLPGPDAGLDADVPDAPVDAGVGDAPTD